MPSIFSNYWLADLFSHFKVQYCFLFLGLLTFNLIATKIKWINLLILAGLCWNASFITPLIYGNKVMAASQTQADISILCINLLSSNTMYTKTEEYIARTKPDVLILIEFNSFWQKNLQNIIKQYPYKKLKSVRGNFGIALLSRLKAEIEIKDFCLACTPSVIANLTVNEEPLTIIGIHPRPPIGNTNFQSWKEHFNFIANNKKTYANNLVVIGDFNMSSYSPQFQNFVSQTSLADSRKGFGILPSWPTLFSPMYTTIDHCLIGGNLSVLNRSTGENIGSDHLPVYVELGVAFPSD